MNLWQRFTCNMQHESCALVPSNKYSGLVVVRVWQGRKGVLARGRMRQEGNFGGCVLLFFFFVWWHGEHDRGLVLILRRRKMFVRIIWTTRRFLRERVIVVEIIRMIVRQDHFVLLHFLLQTNLLLVDLHLEPVQLRKMPRALHLFRFRCHPCRKGIDRMKMSTGKSGIEHTGSKHGVGRKLHTHPQFRIHLGRRRYLRLERKRCSRIRGMRSHRFLTELRFGKELTQGSSSQSRQAFLERWRGFLL